MLYLTRNLNHSRQPILLSLVDLYTSDAAFSLRLPLIQFPKLRGQ